MVQALAWDLGCRDLGLGFRVGCTASRPPAFGVGKHRVILRLQKETETNSADSNIASERSRFSSHLPKSP